MADDRSNLPPSGPASGPSSGPSSGLSSGKRAGVDVRAREIKTGAGLEESKYNTDVIEFLQKYSVYIMLAIVVIAGGWFFYTRFQEKKTDELGAAFEALDKALEPQRSGLDVSPEVLVSIAGDHSGKASVSLLARLAAGDQWLLSSARGLLPGAEVDAQTGVSKNADDVLTSQAATDLLGKAKEQYELVRGQVTGQSGKVIFELRALFGLASVAESGQQWDVAKGHYQSAEALAKVGGYKQVAELAGNRLADLETLKDLPALVSDSQIVTFKKPEPIALPMGVPGLSMPSLSSPGAGLPGMPALTPPSLNTPPAPPAGPSTPPAPVTTPVPAPTSAPSPAAEPATTPEPGATPKP